MMLLGFALRWASRFAETGCEPAPAARTKPMRGGVIASRVARWSHAPRSAWTFERQACRVQRRDRCKPAGRSGRSCSRRAIACSSRRRSSPRRWPAERSTGRSSHCSRSRRRSISAIIQWNDRGVPAGPTWIRIDLGSQLISVFRAGHEIGTAVIVYGGDNKQTPLGKLHILGKARDHRSSLYDAEMPYTLRLTNDGVSIHASRRSLGRRDSWLHRRSAALSPQRLFDADEDWRRSRGRCPRAAQSIVVTAPLTIRP